MQVICLRSGGCGRHCRGIYADLIEWLRLEGRDAEERGWEPAYFELSFGLPDRKESDENSQVEPVPLDCGLNLRGSIDLVEKRRDGSLRATDHKTGKARAEEGERIAGGSGSSRCSCAGAKKLFPSKALYCTSAGGFEDVNALIMGAREADIVASTIMGRRRVPPGAPARRAGTAIQGCLRRMK
jgi:hypothetical protein